MVFLKRGQIALEYIMIIGVLFIIVVPLFFYASNRANTEIKMNLADDAINTIANTVEMVYAMGPGTKEYVRVTIPSEVQYTIVNGTELIMTLTVFGGTSEIVVPTKPIVVGSIPTVAATYKISVEALPDGRVRVGEYNDTTPPIIIWTYPTETISFHDVTLKATTNEYSTCKYDLVDKEFTSMNSNFAGTALTHEDYIGTLSDGTYTYYARCNDTAGNVMTTSEIINFTITTYNGTGNDTVEHVPPVVSLISPPDDSILNYSLVLFEYNVTDASSIIVCSLLIDNTILQSDVLIVRNVTYNFTQGLERGNYSWTVNCTDSHGNEGNSSTWDVTINSTLDGESPIVNLIAPENNSFRNFNFLYFRYNVTDVTSDILKCAVQINSIHDTGSESTQTVIDSSVTENVSESIGVTLDKGNHTWYINCTDDSSQRNVGMSERWFLRVNTTQEESFIDSCGGWCGFNEYADGNCRQTAAQCNVNDEVYRSEGDEYCGEIQVADYCCCVPL
jgi:uncharacterized protein (UPF0333 family)